MSGFPRKLLFVSEKTDGSNGVETFSGLKRDFNSLHKHGVFGSGCLRQSLPGLKGLKVNGVETFSGLKQDFNSLHKHGVFGSGCLRQSLPGLKGLKVSQPSIYRLFLFPANVYVCQVSD